MDIPNHRPGGRWRAILRRTLFFGLTFVTAGGATALLLDVLEANGLSAIEIVGLVLFFALFSWIAGSLWTAIAGFFVRLIGHDRAGIDPRPLAGRPLLTRTAIAMPIYNEDPARVVIGLEAIWTSLKREEQQGAFDLFRGAPEAGTIQQVRRLGGVVRIFRRGSIGLKQWVKSRHARSSRIASCQIKRIGIANIPIRHLIRLSALAFAAKGPGAFYTCRVSYLRSLIE